MVAWRRKPLRPRNGYIVLQASDEAPGAYALLDQSTRYYNRRVSRTLYMLITPMSCAGGIAKMMLALRNAEYEASGPPAVYFLNSS